MILKNTLLLLSIIFTSSFGDKITLVADEWCPYNCKRSDKNQGYLVDITRSIFKKHGHTVEYIVTSS